MSEALQSEYHRRLNLVIDHIYAHLGEPFDLTGLAEVAGFSPYHFHRLFKALTGETLGEYILRTRLEQAANMLLRKPHTPVTEIAACCGFSGPAVFSRTFKQHFGASPSQFRLEQSRNTGQAQRKQGQALPGTPGYNQDSYHPTYPKQRSDLSMNVEIKTLPNMHVIYIRHLYGYSKGVPNAQIGEAFQKVCSWAGAHDLVGPGTLVVGIPYDNPDITPNHKCRYDACVTVPESVKTATGEIGVQDIPGGKYALCRIEAGPGEAGAIAETVDQLYGEWLPGSGYQADDRPPLEIYYPTPGKPAGWICMDFGLPVKPL